MEQKNMSVTESNRAKAERPETEHLAMEVLRHEQEKHKAKDLGLWILGIIAAIALAAGAIERQNLANVNLQNDREWRELFSSYDFITQDGGGQNYYNSEIGGNVNNGAENTEAEK